MIVLGINEAHNASCALAVDGEIIAAAQEERFSRIKNHFGTPYKAIEICLNFAKIQAQDVDLIVFSGGVPTFLTSLASSGLEAPRLLPLLKAGKNIHLSLRKLILATEYQFPTDTPPPPTGTESNPTVAPTAKAVNPIDAATGLDRSTLSVEVQNGSGVTGAASKGSDILKSFGYKVSAIGNADNENYENATIQVKSTKSNYLALLKKDLGFSYTVGTTSADLEPSSTADALVIIGK